MKSAIIQTIIFMTAFLYTPAFHHFGQNRQPYQLRYRKDENRLKFAMLNETNSFSSLDLNPLVFMAECACLCNTVPDEIVKQLLLVTKSSNIINIRVEQRDIEEVGARYNIIDFDEYTAVGDVSLSDSKDISNDNSKKHHWVHKRVIAVRGSRNFKNYQRVIDSTMEFDDFLGINIHRGFKRVFTAILKDLPDHLFSEESQSIPISFTGHSLG